MEITTNAKKERFFADSVFEDEKTEGETFKLRLILFKKRRKDDKQKPKVNFVLWAALGRRNVQTLSLKSGPGSGKNTGKNMSDQIPCPRNDEKSATKHGR